MNFSAIFQQAWRFTWRYKSLWWLGLLASLPQAAGILLLPGWLPASNLPEIELWQLLESISHAGEQWLQPARLAAGTAVAVAAVGLVWLGNLLAEGGLIAAVSEEAGGQPLSLRQAAAAGRQQLKRFVLVDTWLYAPALGITLAALVMLLLLFGILLWGVQTSSNPGAAAALLVTLAGLGGLGLLLLPVLLLVSVARQLTFRAVMGRNVGAREGIRGVGRACRQNPGQTLLMVTLLLALRALLSGAARLTTLPFWLLNLAYPSGMGNGVHLVVNLLADLLHLGLTAIFAVFISVTWTLAYYSLEELGF